MKSAWFSLQITDFVTASDHHSINADEREGSTECLIKVVNEHVLDAEVNVHTPGTSNSERDRNAYA